MRLFSILSLTAVQAVSDDATAAKNSINVIHNYMKLVARDEYFTKKGKVERLAGRIVNRWENKLVSVLENKGCLGNELVNLNEDFTGCAIGEIDRMSHNLHAWLDAFVKTDTKRCRNLLQRNQNKADKAIAKITTVAANGGSLMDCSSGYCRNGKCVFDLSDGGFGGNRKVMGSENEHYSDVIEFSGIKFADSERFRSPVAITQYDNTDFSNDGYSCVTVSAVKVGSESLPTDTELVEDCLYIKIIMKKSALLGSDKTKVMTWIHGGTFNYGGVDAIYESPAKLVDEQDLIVAKMNYRLGPFGNWYFPLNIGGQPKSSWGIQDQRLGMKWVHDHISKFNGDAEDITLSGGSSGGMGVMVHMTSPDSHEYFHNALTIGVPQINFWTEAEATMAYGYITINVLSCTTEDDFVTDALNGNLLGCLQGIPLVNFQYAASAAGAVFKKIAIDANHISQLEQSFALNFDGDIVLGNPRDLIKQNSPLMKSDMGFYIHEMSPNEGTSMTQNLYGNPAFLQTLYGEEAYAQLWQSFNSHIVDPKPAHDGLISKMYGLAGPEFLAGLLHEEALGCPNPVENDPYGGLLTECKAKTSDWVTSWMWHCNTNDAFAGWQTTPTFPVYMVDFAASYPGPDFSEDESFAPSTAGIVDCFEAGEGKACHIVGQAYLFGESDHQNLAQTEAELAFGLEYRTIYANIIKNGSSDKLMEWSSTYYNNLDIGKGVTPSLPHARTCYMFDMIQMYGAI